jgi:hypothetical protein
MYRVYKNIRHILRLKRSSETDLIERGNRNASLKLGTRIQIRVLVSAMSLMLSWLRTENIMTGESTR